jgi:cell division septum initiation protein DivIVA
LIAVLTKEIQQLKQENVDLKQRLERIELMLGI